MRLQTLVIYCEAKTTSRMYFAVVKQAVFCWRGMVGCDSDVIQSRPPESVFTTYEIPSWIPVWFVNRLCFGLGNNLLFCSECDRRIRLRLSSWYVTQVTNNNIFLDLIATQERPGHRRLPSWSDILIGMNRSFEMIGLINGLWVLPSEWCLFTFFLHSGRAFSGGFTRSWHYCPRRVTICALRQRSSLDFVRNRWSFNSEFRLSSRTTKTWFACPLSTLGHMYEYRSQQFITLPRPLPPDRETLTPNWSCCEGQNDAFVRLFASYATTAFPVTSANAALARFGTTICWQRWLLQNQGYV